MLSENRKETLHFGRFEVIRELGRGSMGIVYLAKDPAIDRKVALKVIIAHPELPVEQQESAKKRFEIEARSAGQLDHHNIVTIYDVGRKGDEPYMAMECVEGPSLAEELRSRGPLSFQKVADIAIRLGHALDYAHARGIVHRDIKPGNILLTPEGEPKITDFGLAKLPTARLTEAGTVMGTPAYMSPEQITGKEVTGASDQFALAVILYEMLTGRLPFDNGGATTIMFRIVNDAPRAARAINTELPEALDEALSVGLRKKPEERYPNCMDLARAVQTALGVEPETLILSSSGGFASQRSKDEATETPVPRTETEDTEKKTVVVEYPPAKAPAPASRVRTAVLALIGLAAVVGIGVWMMFQPEAPPDTPTVDESAPGHSLTEWNIEVQSTPPGASIWIEGEDSGLIAPARVQLSGSAGDRVRLELRRGGAVTATTEIVLTPDVPLQWLEPPQSPAAARTTTREEFHIETSPTSASVSLNGKPVSGQTPITIDLDLSQRNSLEITRDGHAPLRWSFTLDQLSAEQLETGVLFFPLRAVGPRTAPTETVIPPRKTVHVRPNYPSEARRRRAGGNVVLELLIDKEGNVSEAEVIGGDATFPLLAESARQAAREWKYEPASRDGEPIAFKVTVTVRFDPND